MKNLALILMFSLLIVACESKSSSSKSPEKDSDKNSSPVDETTKITDDAESKTEGVVEGEQGKLEPRDETYEISETETSGVNLVQSEEEKCDEMGNEFEWRNDSCQSIYPLAEYPLSFSGDLINGKIEQVTGIELDDMAANLGQEGFIITAVTANSVPYTFFAMRSREISDFKYLTRVEQVTGAEMANTMSDLGSSGYLVTEVTSNSAGYTFIGMKREGSKKVYDTRVEQVSGNEVDLTMSELASEGYLVMAVTTNSAGYTFFAVKEKGLETTSKYLSKVEQVYGPEIDATMAELGADGYLVTSVTTNSAGYTFFATKSIDTDIKYSTRVDQVVGYDLEKNMLDLAVGGYIVTAVTTNSAGYTLFSMRRLN